MRSIVLVLAYLACEGHGSRVNKTGPGAASTNWAAGSQVARRARAPGTGRIGDIRSHSSLRLRGGEGEKELKYTYWGTMMGDLATLQTEEDLKAALQEVDARTVVIVICYADWSEPCVELAPVIETLAKSTDRVKFFKINADKATDLLMVEGMNSIPTLLFYRKGELFNRIDAADWATAAGTSDTLIHHLKTILRSTVKVTKHPQLARLESLALNLRQQSGKIAFSAALMYFLRFCKQDDDEELVPIFDINP